MVNGRRGQFVSHTLYVAKGLSSGRGDGFGRSPHIDRTLKLRTLRDGNSWSADVARDSTAAPQVDFLRGSDRPFDQAMNDDRGCDDLAFHRAGRADDQYVIRQPNAAFDAPIDEKIFGRFDITFHRYRPAKLKTGARLGSVQLSQGWLESVQGKFQIRRDLCQLGLRQTS